MARQEEMAITVGEIRATLQHLPDDMTVEITPITSAWLGTMHPMRLAKQPYFYDSKGEIAKPYDPGARMVVYIYEDLENETI